MMSSDLEEEESPSVSDITRLGADDQWSSFVSLLLQSEKKLLELLLQGTRTYDIRMVDSINAKAMDTVGDTIIEEDSLIEDYKEDLRKALEG